MLKALKSYWAYTSGIYKVLMLFAVPILLVFINLVCLQENVGSGIEIFFGVFYLDTILDYFFMGGFYSKNNSSFEFLQSSNRFSQLAKEVVCVDAIRRVLLYQILYCTTLTWTIGKTGEMEWWKTMAYVPWLLTLGAQLVTLISRHYTTWNIIYVCSSIGFLLMGTILIIMLFAEINSWLVSVVLIVGVVIAGLGTCLYTEKKVKESYYDK